MERVVEDLSETLRGRHVVRQATDRHRVRTAATLDVLPTAEQTDQEIPGITFVQKLRKEVEVGHERSLKDDRNVGCVKEFDWVRALLAAILVVLDRKVHTETLEVDNHNEDKNGSCAVQVCV